MMPTHSDILARIRHQLGADELADWARRLVRLPELWAALNRGASEALDDAFVQQGFSPSAFVFGAIPGQAPSPNLSELPTELRTDVERLVADEASGMADSDLASIGLKSLALMALEKQPKGVDEIVERVRNRPNVWLTPLACTWPHLADPGSVLAKLLEPCDLSAARAASVCLLTHHSPDDSAAALMDAFPGSNFKLVAHAHDLGENQLAESMARHVLASDDPARSHRHDPIESLIDQAAAQERVNGPSAAEHLLEAAWDRTGTIRAEIADRLADIAEGSGEPVVAAEALRRAVDETPTPDRRARAALALIDARQIDDGLAMLPSSPESPVDSIAVGLAYARDERGPEAVRYLVEAAEQIAAGDDVHPRWMARLARGLMNANRPGEAARIAQLWSEAAPGSRAARVALAEAQHASGDHDGAVDTAGLLLAQDASDDHVREILAQGMQHLGKPEEALEHWQQLALSNARMLKQVVVCALDADQADLAREQAARWLALDPDSPQALVYYGRSLAACGDTQAATEHLIQATERAPQSPDTWLALAEAQRRSGDQAEADATLARAIQLCPDQPSLLTAKGRALADQDRHSEALEHFEKAIRISADDPEIQLGYGQLLVRLGHVDQAVPALENAQTQRPAHLPSRLALAEAYERIGDTMAAHELVRDIPDGVSDQAQALAGRLAIKAAVKTGDQQVAEHGLHRLQLSSNGEPSAESTYWIAEGLRLTGKPEEAMAAYQSCLNDAESMESEWQVRASHGLASAAIAAGQTPVAISVLESLRQRSGGTPESLLLLSKAYRSAGLPDEALSPAMEAVERDPENADARSEAVAAAIEAEAWGAALAQIDRWTETNPDNPQVWIQKARLHTQLDHADDARAALARALWLDRSALSEALPISRLLTRLGESNRAVGVLKRAVNADPTDDATLKSLAETAERSEDFETALEAWSTLADHSPDDSTALRHIGESMWRLHRRSAAIGYWQKGLAQDPTNVSLALRLSQAHFDNGEPERALDHLRQALALSPDDAQLAIAAAGAFRRHGTPQEALEVLQTAAALVPEDPTLRLAIADTYSEMDSHEDARQVLANLADKVPQPSAAVLARLALSEMSLGHPTESAEAFRGINPEHLDSTEAAVFTARAGFLHAAWPIVDAALQAALGGAGGDPDNFMAAVELRAQLADAEWLYSEGAKAPAHSPQSGTVSPDDALRWIETARRMGVDEAECQRLDQHLALVSGRIDPESLDLESASPAAIESLIIAHLRSGNPERVIAILADHSQVRQSPWAPVLAGLAHLQSQRFTQARKAFGAVAPIPSIKPLAIYFTALALLQQEEVAEAIETLNAALAAWPEEPTWHHTLANAYAAVGQPDMALPHFQQAAELDSDNGAYCLSLARHLQSMGVNHQAEEHYLHALKHFPEAADVWREAGYAALAVGSPDEALTRFRNASQLAPESAEARIGAARAAQASGQLTSALQWAAQAVELAPENSDALLGWADILAAQGKHDKALSAYQRAEAGMTDPTRAQVARSRLFLQTGRPEAAVLELTKVTETCPDDQDAWSNLAKAYEESGDIDQASAAVKKALEIAPADSTHRLSLARLSRKSGQLDHALSELSSLEVERPDDADIAYELARVHDARRDFDKAMDGYRRAIALNREHARAHYHAGLVLKTLKDYDQAAEMFKCAVELSPNDADAHHQLAAVRALELVHGGIQQTSAVAQ